MRAPAEPVGTQPTGGTITPGSSPFDLQYTPDELAEGVELAHSLGKQVTVHAHAGIGIAAAVDAGVDVIEHGFFLAPAGVEADWDIVEKLVKAGTFISTTTARRASDEPLMPMNLQVRSNFGRMHREGVACTPTTPGTAGSPTGSPRSSADQEVATMSHTRRTFLAAGAAGLAGVALGGRATAATWETVLDGSFASYSTLQSAWNHRYPWGADHNGTARMHASAKDPYLPIRYHSGAVHAKQQITVTDQFPRWEVRGEFQAPSARGTWPAFWLTGATSWPPESDILEFKGDARNWFNTYKNAGGVWSNTVVNVGNPGGWHGCRAWIVKVNASDVDIRYYLDGDWVGQHRGAGFVGKPMWLILNLQME